MSEKQHLELRRVQGMSRAFVQGSVGREPYVNEKGTFASFNIATSFSRKKNIPGGGEEWEEISTWWGIKIIGEVAVNRMIRQGITKGSYVQVWLADVEMEVYTDKEGFENSRLTGRAESFANLVWVDSPEGGDSGNPAGGRPKRRQASPQSPAQSSPQSGPIDDDSDVPF